LTCVENDEFFEEVTESFEDIENEEMYLKKSRI